jgi:diguanylate cyclase
MNPVVRPASLDARAPRLRSIAGDLPLCHASVRAAFEAREFEIAYQPILRLPDLRPVACEALLRWVHPRRGAQRPLQFVSIIERSHLSLDVGDWLLETACRQILEWEHMGLGALRLAVNVAPLQVQAPDFVARLQRTLDDGGVQGSRLTLEITQDLLLDRPEVTAAVAAQLSQLGVGLELDDFGGGPSVIGHLKRAGLNGFKLDRRFLDGLGPGPGHEQDTDLRILVGLARKLELRCIAESVQTEDELRAIASLGIGEVQGNLFCSAVPPDALESYLRGRLGGDPARPRATHMRGD